MQVDAGLSVSVSCSKDCQRLPKGYQPVSNSLFLFLASKLHRGYAGEKLSNRHALALQINLFTSRLLLVSLKLVKGNIWNDPKLGRIINWKYDKKNAIENKKY